MFHRSKTGLLTAFLVAGGTCQAETALSPDVRQAIFSQSVTDLLHGHPEVARARIRYLLRSSPDRRDASYLLGVYDQIRRENPLVTSAGLGFSPSSNIDLVSSHETFDTTFGNLLITGGGQEQFGIAASTNLNIRRGTVVGEGAELSLELALGRTISPSASRNRHDAGIGLSFEQLGYGGSFSIASSFGYALFDATPATAPKADYGTLSLSLAWSRYLAGMRTIFGEAQVTRYEFADRPYLDGNVAQFSMGITGPLSSNDLTYSLQASAGRAEPGVRHAVNNFASISAGLEKYVDDHVILGVMAEMGRSDHQSDFPGIGRPRHDLQTAISLSYTDDRIKLFGRSPTVGCTKKESASNVALYSYTTIDCAVSLSVTF